MIAFVREEHRDSRPASTDNLDRRKAVFLLEWTLDKYTPEIILGAFFVLKNIVLIVACAWTTARLYELSGSWHSLWALLMLLAVGSYRFVRD